MKTKRAFLIDAMLRYIGECGQTPYIAVHAEHPDALVPTEYVKDGFIVLNLRPDAVQHFSISDDAIRFSTRFNKVSRHIVAPLAAIVAVYPKENPADGMNLSTSDYSGYFALPIQMPVAAPTAQSTPAPEVPKRPALSVIKGGKDQ